MGKKRKKAPTKSASQAVVQFGQDTQRQRPDIVASRGSRLRDFASPSAPHA